MNDHKQCDPSTFQPASVGNEYTASTLHWLPQAEAQYLAQMVARLQHLAQGLVGVFLFGSAATGAYEPGISDLDIQAVVSQSLTVAQYNAIAASLSYAQLVCPARRLEFVMYRQSAVNPATRWPQFEINFNTGAAKPDHLTTDPGSEASHWFLLDIAMGREVGRCLYGRPPSDIFAPVPRLWCLEAINDSLAWHNDHELASANAVLNACRGWRYAVTGWWGSKHAGAEWARHQAVDQAIIAAAEQRRRGGGLLDPIAAAALVAVVTAAVNAAIAHEQRLR